MNEQLTRADLARMSPDAIVRARELGLLENVLIGTPEPTPNYSLSPEPITPFEQRRIDAALEAREVAQRDHAANLARPAYNR